MEERKKRITKCGIKRVAWKKKEREREEEIHKGLENTKKDGIRKRVIRGQ